MSRKILGLDIRHDAVSAVLLDSGIKETVIQAHEHVRISSQKDNGNGLAVSLKTIFENMDISGSVCVASFPADRISYRNVRVPFKGRKKIKKILPFELEPTYPFPVDDLIIDFQPVKLPNNTNHTDLIAAAVEKSKLQSYLEALATVGIDPQLVTVGGYSTALCLAGRSDIHENRLFVDIDNNKGSVFAIWSGEICLIRSFPIRSDHRSSKIKSLCTNIQRTISAFEEMIDLDFQPDGIVVTGSGLDESGFDQDMAQMLELPVKRMDLVRDTDMIKQHTPLQLWDSHRMDNALSLAWMEVKGVNGLNFRKGPFAAKKFWKEHKKKLIKTGVLTALVLGLAFFNVVLESYFLGKKLAGLDNQTTKIFTSTFPEVKTIVDPFQQMLIKIQEAKKTALFPGETGKQMYSIDILNTISRLIPKEIDVTFTRLVIGLEDVMISGDTDTFNSVDSIKSGLEQADLFTKIDISSANLDKTDNRVRFKLKLSL